MRRNQRIIIIKQSEEIRPKTTGKIEDIACIGRSDNDKVYKTFYHAFVKIKVLPVIEIWEQDKCVEMQATG